METSYTQTIIQEMFGPREAGVYLIYKRCRTYHNNELDFTYLTVDELRYKQVNNDSKIKHHFLAEFMLIY